MTLHMSASYLANERNLNDTLRCSDPDFPETEDEQGHHAALLAANCISSQMQDAPVCLIVTLPASGRLCTGACTPLRSGQVRLTYPKNPNGC